MTSPVLQIVDSATLSTVLFDLSDNTGVNNAGSGGSVTCHLGNTLDWGLIAWEFDRVQSESPGGQTARVRAPLVDAKLPVRFGATSYDNLNLGLGYLSRLLAGGCTMKWVPAGSANTRYVDFEPSLTPILINGQALAQYTVQRLFQTPEEATLNLTRQPFFYGTELLPSVQMLTNPFFLHDQDLDATPTGWTKGASATLAYDTANNAMTGTINATGDIIYENAVTVNATTYTYSLEVFTVSGTRTVQIQLRAHGGAVLGSTTVTATTFGTRASVTAAATGTATDCVLATTAGSGSTVVEYRFAQLEAAGSASAFRAGSSVVSNDPADATNGNKVKFVHNTGDAPAPALVKIKGDSGAKLDQAMIAVRSAGSTPDGFDLYDYVNRNQYLECNLGTAGVDTTASVVDANASGGHAAKTTFASVSGMANRIRVKQTSVAAAMRGSYYIFVRVVADATSTYRVQAKWALGDITPATWSNDQVPLDFSQISSFTYTVVNLGKVDFPVSGAFAGAAVELWASQDSGSGNLWWDYVQFVPCDEALGWLAVPSATSSTKYPGSELASNDVSLATISGDDPLTVGSLMPNGTVLLNNVDEACAIGASTGLTLATGHHTFTVSIAIGANFVGQTLFRIVDVTAGTAITRVINAFQGVPSEAARTIQVDAAGHNYQPQVLLTSYSAGGVNVSAITDTFAPTVASGEYMQADTENSTAYKLDSSGNAVFPLQVIGQLPVWLPPGVSALVCDWGETPNDGYLADKNTLTRAPTVSVQYAPRYYS